MKDDQSFERLLRKARPAEPAPSGIGPCLDAETLAAWVDGGLRSNALRQAELHVSMCARCQAMVSATMTSAPLVAASETERRAFSWSLRWLVPAAAGVAAVGLWFMVPSPSQPTPAPASQVVELDRREIAQAPVEQPAVPSAASAPSPARDLVAPEQQAAKLADAASPKNEERSQAASPDAAPETFRTQRADEFAPVRSRQEADSKDLVKAAPADAAAKAQPAPPPAPAAPAAAGAVSGSTATAAAAPRAALSAIAANRTAGFQALIEILSPNASMRWRIAPGGSIEHSTDAGASWTPQSSGVSLDLLAGSSPSADVCWLVGRGGTVLRTTDGGRQWQRVTVVGGVDLQAVTATDASTAEVTATDGRRFRTVDAGITWR